MTSNKKQAKKKLVFIPENLVNKLMEASSREGKTFNVFVEEALNQVLNAFEKGYTPQELTSFIEVIQTQRMSMTLIPLQILNYLMKNAEKNQLETQWYEAGEWYGKYLSEKFEEPVQMFKRLLEATRWELDEINVEEENDSASFRCVSAIQTIEETMFLLKFIQGTMHSLEYRTDKKDYLKGLILLHFHKKVVEEQEQENKRDRE